MRASRLAVSVYGVTNKRRNGSGSSISFTAPEQRAAFSSGMHAGRASTKVAGEGIDYPLETGGWELISASAVSYLPIGLIPKAMNRDDMDRGRGDFVAATRRAAAAGWGWVGG